MQLRREYDNRTKRKYIKLLQKNGSVLAKAVLFYLLKSNNKAFEKKSAFVEKLLDNHADILSVSADKYQEYIVWKNIPDEISQKLISSYRKDLIEDKKNSDDQLIAEMNEIF